MEFAKRNNTIDILRAFVMFLMIFVNDFWTVRGVPHCLEHAGQNEDFLGLADYIFPAFLFVVGLSIPYAIERRYAKGHSELEMVFHVLGRSLALWVMGVFFANVEAGLSSDVVLSMPVFRILMIVGFCLVWNNYPKTTDVRKKTLFTILKISGVALLVYLSVIFRDSRGGIFQARWWGILGSIGWTYLVCAFVYFAFRRNIFKHAVVWIVLVVLCMLESDNLIPRESFLQAFLKMLHIPPGAKTAFCMGGILTSLITMRTAGWKMKFKVLLSIGIIASLIAAGSLTHGHWIVSKNLQTPPTLFYCTAAVISAYVLIAWLVSKGWTKAFQIISPAGTSTLTCYLIPVFMTAVMRLLNFGPVFQIDGIYGLLKCFIFSFICICVAGLLERIHIKLKI